MAPESKGPHQCPWPIDHAHWRLGQFQRSRFRAESPTAKFPAASESGRRPMAHGPISSHGGGVRTGTGDLRRPMQQRLASPAPRTQGTKSNPGRTARTCNQCRYGIKNRGVTSAKRCLRTGLQYTARPSPMLEAASRQLPGSLTRRPTASQLGFQDTPEIKIYSRPISLYARRRRALSPARRAGAP